MGDALLDQDAADAFAGRVFASAIGAFETLAIYVGDRLGLYDLLRESPRTIEELAAASGMHPRYAREWVEGQATAGILTLGDDDRFALPAAHAAVLADRDSLAYSPPMARMVVAAASRMPSLLEAYRSGGGVSWEEFGSDARDAQGDINRPWFRSELAAALRGVDDLHAVLSQPGARIADVGCGHGWSTIALALAYPEAHVVGMDVDAPSIETARLHANGIENVEFLLASGADAAGPFDAAFVFEALHDMPDPVGVLAGIRATLREGGPVIVMDEAVAPQFSPDGDEIERIMYGYSLFVCLPDSMSTPGSVGTGTVMRPSVLEQYARGAGFAGVEVLPIEGFAAFRFYRLHG